MTHPAFRYVKAIAALLASFIATLLVLLGDDQISFDEIEVLYAAGVALVTGFFTLISPKNTF